MHCGRDTLSDSCSAAALVFRAPKRSAEAGAQTRFLLEDLLEPAKSPPVARPFVLQAACDNVDSFTWFMSTQTVFACVCVCGSYSGAAVPSSNLPHSQRGRVQVETQWHAFELGLLGTSGATPHLVLPPCKFQTRSRGIVRHRLLCSMCRLAPPSTKMHMIPPNLRQG